MNKIKWILLCLYGLTVIYTIFFIVSFFIWNASLVRGFMTFIFLCLIISLGWIRYSVKSLKREFGYQMSPIRNFAHQLYKETYIWELDRNGKITYISDSVNKILGYDPNELTEHKFIWELNAKSDHLTIISALMDCMIVGKTMVGFENTVYTKGGTAVTVLSATIPMTNQKGEIVGLQGWDTDITKEKNIEISLKDNEALLRSLFENMNEAFVVYEMLYDDLGNPYNYVIVEYNKNYLKFINSDLEDSLKGKKITDVFNSEDPPFFDKFKEVENNKSSLTFNRYISVLKKYFRISLFSPSPSKVAAIYTDITQSKTLDETIENLSYIDKQTTLHNRRYFEESIPFFTTNDKLPLAIILADLNALKLTNDVFGHTQGDKLIEAAANLLNQFKDKADLLARIGGDEFVLLKPLTSYEEGVTIIKAIAKKAESIEVDSINMSISLGFDVLKGVGDDTFYKVFSKAESKLYAYKLKRSFDTKKMIFNKITKLLYETYPHEKKHAQNVMELTLLLAEYLNMESLEKSVLKEAAYYHDIGKVHLTSDILACKTFENEDEWLKIKRHPEIGYRITSSIINKAAYSEYILAHHENYDGTGYPRRIKGKDIPLFSRMIRITEAYDSMVNGYYKASKTKEIAIDILLEHKGTYFDPSLVDAFVKVIE